MIFAAGATLGTGIGVIIGLAVGTWFLNQTTEAMNKAIDKATYAVAFPHPDTPPVQVPSPETEHAFDPQEVDDELMPDWMDEDYKMAGS